MSTYIEHKVQKLIYCLCGDGELQEGQIWEAIMFAGAKKIDNLIFLILTLIEGIIWSMI